MSPAQFFLTVEQRANDPAPNPLVEALAVHLYETDPESAYNEEGHPVYWRDNYAHRDRYRHLAQSAVNFLGSAQ